MSWSLVYRPLYPNRLELHVPPGTRGPMRRFIGNSTATEDMDPSVYVGIYSGGKPMKISNFVWDDVGNRYILYTSEAMPSQFVQAIYHIPDPPFWLQSNPTLSNISSGYSPSLGGPD